MGARARELLCARVGASARVCSARARVAAGGAAQWKAPRVGAEGCDGRPNRDGGWAQGWQAAARGWGGTSKVAPPTLARRDCTTEGAPGAASAQPALCSGIAGGGVRIAGGGRQCGVGK